MRAINETNRRRALQEAYNEKHGITPETIISAVRNLIAITRDTEELEREGMSPEDRAALVAQLEDKMLSAAGELDFEKAAKYRDELFTLKGDKPLEKQQPQPVRRRRGTRHH